MLGLVGGLLLLNFLFCVEPDAPRPTNRLFVLPFRRIGLSGPSNTELPGCVYCGSCLTGLSGTSYTALSDSLPGVRGGFL